MARKVIIDCDPGIDDAVALTMALFDPRLEVVAVTAVAGNVPAKHATLNVQALIEQLDPPRFPRIGAATPPDDAPSLDARHIHGEDGLGNAGLNVSQHARQHPSVKLICDEVRAAPGEVTLLCLGPLTNIASAIQRDPGIIPQMGRLVIMGGAVHARGNVTPCSEFNIFCDPRSAREVFRSTTTKTLVPLDATDQVIWDLELIQQLPPESSRAGKLLHCIIPFLFRAYRREFGQECIHIHDAVALAAVLHPELFTTHELHGDVELRGELTTGMTVFDRRPQARSHGNTEVALELDAPAVRDCVVRGLQEAGRQTA